MEVISWKNMPIFTEIILLLIRQNTIPMPLTIGIVFGHISDKGWQTGNWAIPRPPIFVSFAITLMCLSIGTPKNNKFSICSKWKIHKFRCSKL